MPGRLAIAGVIFVAAAAAVLIWSPWGPDAGERAAAPALEPSAAPDDVELAPIRVDPASLPAGSDRAGKTAAAEAIASPGTRPDPVAPDTPPVVVADFPPYLHAVERGFPLRIRNGCKSVSLLLQEMSEEQRDELWATRVENELRKLPGRHPLGFQVTVGCRATICQVTEVGILTESVDPVMEREWARFWGDFKEKLRNSPVASEFATARFFAGPFSSDLTPELGEIHTGSWHIAGHVLTSVGQATPDEPADCAPFAPLPDSLP